MKNKKKLYSKFLENSHKNQNTFKASLKFTNKKIIVILGQTSTGKSDFAVEIAKKINGEIISADSRQVYKGMDLGTGKITKKEMRAIPHHLLDIISPKKIFSINDFDFLNILHLKADYVFSFY